VALELLDQKAARGEATRQSLMRSAERLFAEKGANNVTIREIVETAGQKNESALQYHFKNLEGLIAATHRYRDAQIVAVRSRCLDEIANQPNQPHLRDIAVAMVHPTFELAGKYADFRRYIRGFSLSLATSDVPPLISVRRGSREIDERLGDLLRAALPQLDNESYRRRLDAAIRYVSVSVYGHAQQPNAFRGKTGELFYHHLIDTLVGLLSAVESSDTKALSREVAIFEGRLLD
jgi:AcrR family transcriptional regulator